jgi:putative ABC transport system ATP-binding protein
MTPVIQLRNVSRTYPGTPPVYALRPADFELHEGEYVTVTGPSGSGKSTFLNVIGLLDRPTQGIYKFDGQDLGNLSDSQRTAIRGRHIGFVFQSFHLMPYRSTLENVALAMIYHGTRTKDRMAAAATALDRVSLAARATALTNTLSGGERQRVAIARAVVHRPRLLLCDEPTGNLDTVTAASVLSLLDRLHGDGMTIIVITHDPDVAARGQRKITICDGHLS